MKTKTKRVFYVRTVSFFNVDMMYEFGDFMDAADFGDLSVQARNISHAYLLSDKMRVINEFRNTSRIIPIKPPSIGPHGPNGHIRNGRRPR